jgi:phosphate transport system substrate-binding protein
VHARDSRARPVVRHATSWAIFALAIALANPPECVEGATASAAPLVFAGSGTNLAITRLLGQAFVRTRPDVTIEVPASIGSTGAIQAAADGTVALGLTSRPLKEPEKALGLKVRPYARSAIVFGAHPTVGDDGISFDELLGIYRGTKTRWRDGREIVVLSRQPTDSGIEVLEREIPGFREVYAESQKAKRWITLYTDQEMNQALVKTPYAIGLLDLGIIQSEHLAVKPLRVNGVARTDEAIQNGTYPLVKTLAFVYRETTLAPNTKAFLDFLRSKPAQELLRAHKYQTVE